MRPNAQDNRTRCLLFLVPLALTAPALAGSQYAASIDIDPPIICVGCTATVTVTAPSGAGWEGRVGVGGVCFTDGGGCDNPPCAGTETCPPFTCAWPPSCNGSPSCGPICKHIGGGTYTFTIVGTNPGHWTVWTEGSRALHSCGDWWADVSEFTVVGVASIKWKDPVTLLWMNSPNPLNIFKDTPVTFKAFPTPSDTPFPSGKPVWGGSSGASGSGDTTTVTFSAKSTTCTDYKTVTASCSNPLMTVNGLVYVLNKNFVPADVFTGRSYDNYGLWEDVTLGVIPDPCGGDPGQWISTGYPPDSLAGSALTCAKVPCSHVLKYRITSGPSTGRGPQFSIGVYAPSGTWMKQDNSGNCPTPGEWKLHTNGVASAGFIAWYFLEPRDVSFGKLEFQEGSAPADQCIATGVFSQYDHNYSHPSSTWGPVRTGAGTELAFGPGTGCYSGFHDESAVESFTGAYESGGVMTYPIPLNYRIGAGGTPQQFDQAQPVKELDFAGYVTVSKKGIEVGRAVSDPTCPFP